MKQPFNYSEYIESLRASPEKHETIDLYENAVGPIGRLPLSEETWYKILVKPFRGFNDFLKPTESENIFDWELLAQLAAASFSSEVGFDYYDGAIHMIISVNHFDRHVTKSVDELWAFQIVNLFEIYIAEQINLCSFWHEDLREEKDILQMKETKLKKWNFRINEIKHRIKTA